MEPRSNYTPQQLISTAPTEYRNEELCVAWFADCYRWATIEYEEPIKEVAWKAKVEINDLCKRVKYIDELLGMLKAYIKIVCIEDPKEPDLEIEEPENKDTKIDLTVTWPVKGSEAKEPQLPNKTPLN